MFLLLAALAPAVPVPPPNPNYDRPALESLWADLAAADPATRTKAAIALRDHPAAVPFLVEKALPVGAAPPQACS